MGAQEAKVVQEKAGMPIFNTNTDAQPSVSGWDLENIYSKKSTE
jgi:hypothetical protein